MPDLPTVPVKVRVHLAHATVEAIAAGVGADVLHIKGPAVDASLRPEGTASMDADVLVRPSQLDRFLAALRRYGWQEVKPLTSGGLVQHSTNWFHDMLGQLDVHVRFPGVQVAPELAFDALWSGRGSHEIAHRLCTVPSITGQRLLLLLHAARHVPSHADDISAAWTQASSAAQADVLALARRLDAEVALSVAIGDIEQYRERPEYELWRLYADGETTSTGFRRLRAEIKATPAGFKRVRFRTIGYAFSVLLRTPQRLKAGLGRKPTRVELSSSYAAFFKRSADLLKPHTAREVPQLRKRPGESERSDQWDS